MSNLPNRVDELERKVERLRKYIIIRDGLWIEEHLDELDNFIISYEGVGDVDLRLQLEFDNLMMCRAHVQEDFLEYCRRAALQIEGLSDWALRKEDNREPAQLKRKWNIVQQNKSRRWHSPYEKEDYPRSIDKIQSMDALELSYCVFTGGRYYIDADKKKKFKCLLNTMRMRNVASHREEETNPKTRMSDEEKEFYNNRDNNYQKICSCMENLNGLIERHFEEE